MLVSREVAESSKCINMTLLFCHGERERERARERDPQMEVFRDYLNITLYKYQ